MTEQAAQHLARLPGFEPTGLSGRLVRDFTPPRKVPPWSGLEEGFEAWVGPMPVLWRRRFTGEICPRTTQIRLAPLAVG